jgi:CDP-glucose 4,6-dehydratase
MPEKKTEKLNWNAKRVLITGHTGFKGGWLALYLAQKKADVIGYALPPPSKTNLFELAGVGDAVSSIQADVRDLDRLEKVVSEYRPQIVFHLAAQPIVGYSYQHPVETFETNVMGTVNVLEAVRRANSVRAVVIVTSDKCYEDKGWEWGYRETDSIGGHDPYSSSKGCAELVTDSYRQSYFQNSTESDRGRSFPPVASVRAGNVIGGGDWAQDRLIPDVIRGLLKGSPVEIRNRQAIRPWQHVLDPLSGYVRVAEKLWEYGSEYAEAWNFGPSGHDAFTVGQVVRILENLWEDNKLQKEEADSNYVETKYLRLDTSKALMRLGWNPLLSTEEALAWTVEWYKSYRDGKDIRKVTGKQITRYKSLKGG